jgi:PAS domain S-box-containing protein
MAKAQKRPVMATEFNKNIGYESAAILRTMIDASPLPIVALDRNGTVQLWNPGAAALFGWSQKEVLGCILPNIPEDNKAEFESHLSLHNQGQSVLNKEIRRRRKDGSLIDLRLWTTPLRDASGNIIGAMAIYLDDSERKRAEAEELIKIEKELQRANELKSKFLARVTHELRDPLQPIIGFSELLAEESAGKLNEKQKQQVTTILRRARDLHSLVEGILDLSKIDAGKFELHPESFLADVAIREVLSDEEPAAIAKKIRISNLVDPDLVIWADRLRFKEILKNLLSNAIKFTPHEGKVSISANLNDQSVSISVADNGIGIPFEEQNAIFEEFHRVETSEGTIGTGLGLAICRGLVEEHSGRIKVTSEVGKGSCFTFSLPLHSEDWASDSE